MNRRKKWKRKGVKRPRLGADQGRGNAAIEEKRATVAVVVLWMLATMICGTAQLVGMTAWLVGRALPTWEFTETIYAVSMMVAGIVGVIALVAAFLAMRLSRVKPPKAIYRISICISVAPLVFLLLRI